jgi:mutator protein MutT
MSKDTRRTLLFLIKNDRILLAMKKRGFGVNRWNGVGGKLEAGETLEQALVRECQEEIEVTPKSWQLVAEHDFTGETREGDPWHMYVYAYFCDDWEGEPTETEEMAPQWFDIADIPYRHMWQDDEFWLPLALEGKKLFGTYTFDADDNMLTHTIEILDALPSERKAVA